MAASEPLFDSADDALVLDYSGPGLTFGLPLCTIRQDFTANLSGPSAGMGAPGSAVWLTGGPPIGVSTFSDAAAPL